MSTLRAFEARPIGWCFDGASDACTVNVPSQWLCLMCCEKPATEVVENSGHFEHPKRDILSRFGIYYHNRANRGMVRA